MKTYKKIMFLIIFIIVFIVIIKNNYNTIKMGSDIKIFVATDTHYLARILTDSSEAFKKFTVTKDGKQLLYIDEIMEAFIDDIKIQKPDILVISGDLTTNGEAESHKELAKKLDRIEKLGTEVFVVPGNHDTKNIWARGFIDGKQVAVDSIDQVDFKNIYKSFGFEQAISKDETTLSYLAAPSEDIWLLMLDSNLYIEDYGMPTNKGKISNKTLEWIKECSKLAKEKDAKIITVMHHNMLKHNERMSVGNTIEDSDESVLIFKELNLDLVLSGHIHIQDIEIDKDDSGTLYDIATSALSVYPQQYGVIKYTAKDDTLNYNTSQINVNKWAKDNNIDNKDLLNFKDFAKNEFYSRPYNRAYMDLSDVGGYTEEEMDQMSNVVAILNVAYYTGNVSEIMNDIKNSEVYQLILDTDSNYVYDFVYSMMLSGENINIKLEIPNYKTSR